MHSSSSYRFRQGPAEWAETGDHNNGHPGRTQRMQGRNKAIREARSTQQRPMEKRRVKAVYPYLIQTPFEKQPFWQVMCQDRLAKAWILQYWVQTGPWYLDTLMAITSNTSLWDQWVKTTCHMDVIYNVKQSNTKVPILRDQVFLSEFDLKHLSKLFLPNRLNACDTPLWEGWRWRWTS